MRRQGLLAEPSSSSSDDSLYRVPVARLSSQSPRSPEPSNAVADGELSFTGSPATPDPLIGKYCKLCAAHSHVLVMLPVRPECVLLHPHAARPWELRVDSEEEQEEHMILTQITPIGK